MSRALPMKRLAQLCGLFGSDHDGERATAAQMADRLVRDHGLTWPDVLRPAVAGADRLPLPWRDACEAVLGAGCTAWESQFCRKLLSTWGRPELTARQASVLAAIFAARVDVRRRA
jgi:hypothetical protein